jgi:hypothetical protein
MPVWQSSLPAEALSAIASLANVTNSSRCADQPVEIDVLYYLLGGFNVFVLLCDVWQLARLMGISRETGLKYNGKRLFHWVLGASLLLRAFFFFASPSLCLLPSYPWSSLYVWVNHTDEVLFFFAFFLLLSFWTDLITSLKGPGSPLTPACLKWSLVAFIIVLAAALSAALAVLLVMPQYVLLIDAFFAGLVDVLSILAAILFLVLGVILYRLLRKTDQLLTVNVEKKKSMAKTVFLVTALCSVCFIFRVIVSIYSITQEFNGSGTNSFDVPPAIVFLYFFLPEIVGSSLMLFLLRVPNAGPKRPPIQHVQEYRRIV